MKAKSELLKMNDKNGFCFFGGDQDWYSSNSRAMAGCSSVAGANILRSMAKSNRHNYETVKKSRIPSPVKRALLSDSCQKDDYLMLMTDVYNTMGSFEIFPLNKIYDRKKRDNSFFKIVRPNTGRSSIGFIQGVLLYARKLGLFLKYEALPTAYMDKETATLFVKKGLNTSGAVVILTSYNKHSIKTQSKTCTMKCHFATITDISNEELTISTWGKSATINLDELHKSWQSIKAWESTLFYFSPTDKRGMIMSFLKSPIPFIKGILQAVRIY